MPRILKGLDLRVRFLSARAFEKHVVVGLAVEGWIKIDQIDAIAFDALAKHREVVAVEKLVQSA